VSVTLAQLQAAEGAALANPAVTGARAPQAWMMTTGIECS